MKVLACLVLVVAASLIQADAAQAQIISTTMPIEPASTGSQGTLAAEQKMNVHLMTGFASWDFDTGTPDLFTTSTGGRNGLIVAGDVAFHLPGRWSAGVGGWFNSVQEYSSTLTF